MKLWLLERKKNRMQYDVTLGMVVRASTQTAARKQAQGAKPKDDYEDNLWLDPKKSDCEPLTYSGPAGLIIEDFNAG